MLYMDSTYHYANVLLRTSQIVQARRSEANLRLTTSPYMHNIHKLYIGPSPRRISDSIDPTYSKRINIGADPRRYSGSSFTKYNSYDRLNRTMADHDMDIIKILAQGNTIPNYPDT